MTDTFQNLPMMNNHQLSSSNDVDVDVDASEDDFSASSSLLLPPFAKKQQSKKKKKKPYVSPSMQGYQQKMKLAQSSKGICYGSGQTVGRMPLKQLLLLRSQKSNNINNHNQNRREIPNKFQVPMFQRRYCWTETQWQTLLMDAATTGTDSVHSLGRLTCTNTTSNMQEEEKVATEEEDPRSVILDGQQRFTTVTLLLAAIRDTLYKRLQRSLQNKLRLDQEKATRIIGEIEQILFPDQEDYQQWLNSSSSTCSLQEGIELSFAKLIPTYCDRWSYYSAILPAHAQIANRLTLNNNNNQSFHRPLAAKQYYDGMLATFSNGEVFHLLDGIYHKLTMLVFPIEVAGRSQEYGTEDLMVVYERLAIRDATFCQPTRSDEYIKMSGLDMIRNALLGTFASPQDALEFYQSFWLPMERMAATSAASSGDNDETQEDDGDRQQEQEEGNMQSMMNAFLDQEENQNLEQEEEKLEEGTVGGLLYVRFQLWQDKQLLLNESSSSSESAEQVTRQQGQAMLAFAKNYFQSS